MFYGAFGCWGHKDECDAFLSFFSFFLSFLVVVVVVRWFLSTGFLCIAAAILDLLCRPGWLRTSRDPPASASQVQGLKACATTLG
jgi:hypothetical protein